MFPDGQDPYTLLGVTREASLSEIRERYRILVHIWHPDKHQSSPTKVREEATRQMQQINAAYKLLTDIRERETGKRETRERQTSDREARDREARDREARERQARERQTREREHPRAQWTHPTYERAGQRGTTWNVSLTIHPIAISFPSGEEGYTLRAYLDDQETAAAFLGVQGRPLLFRSTDSMRRYLTRTEAHALADVPGWESFVDQVTGTGIEIGEEQCFYLDLILYSLSFPPEQWVPSLFIANRDLIREISEAFDLQDVLELLSVGSPLDHLDDLLRVADRPIAGWAARRQLGSLQSGPASAAWRKVIRRIERRVRWLR